MKKSTKTRGFMTTRILTTGLAIGVGLMLLWPMSAEASSLTDVTAEDWYHSDVTYLTEKRIVNGYSDGTFRPDNQVQVDAFIKMMLTAMGHSLENGTTYWASTYIDKALATGLIKEGEFARYDRPISRGEMAMIGARGFEQVATIGPYRHYAWQIEDMADIPEAQKNSVMIAMSEGLITGFGDYTFKASAMVTRAQAATVIARVLDESRRKKNNVFEAKMAKLDKEKSAMTDRTKKMFAQVDAGASFFAGHPIGIGGKEDAYKLLNWASDKLDGYLKVIEGFDLSDEPEQFFDAQGISWHMRQKTGHQQFKAKEDGQDIVVDRLEDVAQLIMTHEGSGLSFEIERHLNGQLFYVEVVNPAENLRIGYLFNLEKEAKYEIIREIDAEGQTLFEVILKNNITVYSDKNTGAMYKYVNPTKSEYEVPKGEQSEIYVQVDGVTIYSDVVEGKLTGRGYKKTKDGEVYIGDFVDSNLTGQGVLFFKNGIVLEGEFDRFVPTVRKSVFTGPKGDLEELTAEMERVIEQEIQPNMTRLEKIRAIHDYLVRHVTYAEDTVEDDLADMDYNNGYTAIMEGSSVCLGYAQAMNLFMEMLGIDSYIVLGDTDRDGQDDHAWNYIYTGIHYRHVDVTWDDPDSGNHVRHEYLIKSDSDIRSERHVSKILGWDK